VTPNKRCVAQRIGHAARLTASTELRTPCESWIASRQDFADRLAEWVAVVADGRKDQHPLNKRNPEHFPVELFMRITT